MSCLQCIMLCSGFMLCFYPYSSGLLHRHSCYKQLPKSQLSNPERYGYDLLVPNHNKIEGRMNCVHFLGKYCITWHHSLYFCKLQFVANKPSGCWDNQEGLSFMGRALANEHKRYPSIFFTSEWVSQWLNLKAHFQTSRAIFAIFFFYKWQPGMLFFYTTELGSFQRVNGTVT